MSAVFPHFPKTPLTLAIYSLSGYPMGAAWDPPPHPHAPAQYNPPNPLSLPPPPPCLVSGDGLRRHLHSANLSRVSLTTSASRISARQHQTSLLVTKPVSSHHLPHSLASDHQPFSYFWYRLFFQCNSGLGSHSSEWWTLFWLIICHKMSGQLLL